MHHIAANSRDRSTIQGAEPSSREVCLGGAPCDARGFDEAVEDIIGHARSVDEDVLGVISINLDHLHHLGTGALMPSHAPGVTWLSLVDGAPLAGRAAKVLGRPVARLARSDLS